MTRSIREEDDYAKANDLSRELFLNLDELKIIYRLLEHEYISYRDLEAHELITKIGKIVNEP